VQHLRREVLHGGGPAACNGGFADTATDTAWTVHLTLQIARRQAWPSNTTGTVALHRGVTRACTDTGSSEAKPVLRVLCVVQRSTEHIAPSAIFQIIDLQPSVADWRRIQYAPPVRPCPACPLIIYATAAIFDCCRARPCSATADTPLRTELRSCLLPTRP